MRAEVVPVGEEEVVEAVLSLVDGAAALQSASLVPLSDEAVEECRAHR